MPQAAWYAITSKNPEKGVERGGLLAEEVPRRIMSRRGLWDFIVGLGFQRVYQVWKVDGILNEENWDIVAHNVEIAFISIASIY